MTSDGDPSARKATREALTHERPQEANAQGTWPVDKDGAELTGEPPWQRQRSEGHAEEI